MEQLENEDTKCWKYFTLGWINKVMQSTPEEREKLILQRNKDLYEGGYITTAMFERL